MGPRGHPEGAGVACQRCGRPVATPRQSGDDREAPSRSGAAVHYHPIRRCRRRSGSRFIGGPGRALSSRTPARPSALTLSSARRVGRRASCYTDCRSMTTRLHALRDAGTALWLDYIDRTMLASGELDRRIRDDALMGMTSNPTIFEKALAERHRVRRRAGRRCRPSGRPAPASSGSPPPTCRPPATPSPASTRPRRAATATSRSRSAPTSRTMPPARSPRRSGSGTTVNRPNLMIKVPGTLGRRRGACEALIADGLNVNVTLLFSIEAHARVIEAYLRGLEIARRRRGCPSRTWRRWPASS